jgi:ribonuclease HI
MRQVLATLLPMKATDSHLIAYTDGGCRGNPGIGGWAFLLIDAATGTALERTGGEALTTNNRMEMTAAIMVLRAVRKPDSEIVLYSDSQLLVKSVTEWIPGWKAKGWRKKGGELKNVDLLQQLDELTRLHRIAWKWVRGHAGNRGNERVDELTNEVMDRIASGADPNWERRTKWKEMT